MGRPRAVITKRTCIIVLMLLAGGAIVNVAVAWGFAIRFDPFDKARVGTQRGWFEMPMSMSQGQPVDWWVQKREAIGTKTFFASVGHSDRSGRKGAAGSTVVEPWTGYPGLLHDQTILEKNLIASGWPLVSVCCRWGIEGQVLPDGTIVPPVIRFAGGFGKHAIPSNLSQVRALPYTPIWPGFAINAVFYAAILWGLFAVPLALRKRRRIKRGWCPKCAYDLRGRPPAPTSTVCPECGAAVAPSGEPLVSCANKP